VVEEADSEGVAKEAAKEAGLEEAEMVEAD